jgi:hypothetical protein
LELIKQGYKPLLLYPNRCLGEKARKIFAGLLPNGELSDLLGDLTEKTL